MENLILFDENLEIKYFINSCNLEKKDNTFNEHYKFISVDVDLFMKLSKLSETNKLIFKVNPINISINVDNINIIPLPPVIKPLTKEEVLAKALMETEIENVKLKNQTKALAESSMESELSTVKLQNQVTALSKAILELSLK